MTTNFDPAVLLAAMNKLLNEMDQLKRTVTRLETRVCKLSIHMGAADTVGITTTSPNPRQLELTFPSTATSI